MDKKYQVFISSTYTDLIEERKSKLTDYGVLCRMDEGMENSEEEEFE